MIRAASDGSLQRRLRNRLLRDQMALLGACKDVGPDTLKTLIDAWGKVLGQSAGSPDLDRPSRNSMGLGTARWRLGSHRFTGRLERLRRARSTGPRSA